MKNKVLVILFISFSFNLIGENFAELRPSKATLTMKSGDMDVWLEKKAVSYTHLTLPTILLV